MGEGALFLLLVLNILMFLQKKRGVILIILPALFLALFLGIMPFTHFSDTANYLNWFQNPEALKNHIDHIFTWYLWSWSLFGVHKLNFILMIVVSLFIPMLLIARLNKIEPFYFIFFLIFNSELVDTLINSFRASFGLLCALVATSFFFKKRYTLGIVGVFSTFNLHTLFTVFYYLNTIVSQVIKYQTSKIVLQLALISFFVNPHFIIEPFFSDLGKILELYKGKSWQGFLIANSQSLISSIKYFIWVYTLPLYVIFVLKPRDRSILLTLMWFTSLSLFLYSFFPISTRLNLIVNALAAVILLRTGILVREKLFFSLVALLSGTNIILDIT